MTMLGQGSRENTAVESDTEFELHYSENLSYMSLQGVSRQNPDNVGLNSVKILTGIQIAVGWK